MGFGYFVLANGYFSEKKFFILSIASPSIQRKEKDPEVFEDEH